MCEILHEILNFKAFYSLTFNPLFLSFFKNIYKFLEIKFIKFGFEKLDMKKSLEIFNFFS